MVQVLSKKPKKKETGLAIPEPFRNELSTFYAERIGNWYSSFSVSHHRKQRRQFFTPAHFNLNVALQIKICDTIMKEKIRNIFRRLGCLLLIVCGIGLALALIGLVFTNDSLYFLGLVLSSPLFLIVLPFCLLLVVLFELGSIYVIISSLYSAFRIKHPPDCKTDEEKKGKNV